MAGPELTEKLEGPLWKRDQPVLGALAVTNKKQAARAVEIGNPEMYSLLQAKPARVDDDQTSAIDRKTNEVKNTPDLLGREDDGQFLFPRRANEIEEGDLPGEDLSIEVLDPVESKDDRAPQAMLDVFEKEKVLPDLFLRDEVRGLVVVVRQLTHGADVGILCTLGKTSQLK